MLIFCGLLFIGTVYVIYKGEEKNMNRLEEVLKLFDLKVEQEFKLTNSSAFYKISKFGQIYFKIEE